MQTIAMATTRTKGQRSTKPEYSYLTAKFTSGLGNIGGMRYNNVFNGYNDLSDKKDFRKFTICKK